MLDADMLLAERIHSLWQLFDQFNRSQVSSVTNEFVFLFVPAFVSSRFSALQI